MAGALQSERQTGLKVKRRRTLGTVTVELAIVAPILIVLLFGIIEFGALFKDVLGLKQAAREGVRVAAVGATTTEITDRIVGSVHALNSEDLDIQLQYRTYSSGWGAWYGLGDMDSGAYVQNDAPQGSQIRVIITYPHQLITGGLFPQLADDSDGDTVTLTVVGVMRRE